MKIRKIACGVLAAVILIAAVVPNINMTKGYDSFTTILSFEQTNPVFEESVDFGTNREQLNLPATLRAVVELTTSPSAIYVEPETEDPYGNYQQGNTTSPSAINVEPETEDPYGNYRQGNTTSPSAYYAQPENNDPYYYYEQDNTTSPSAFYVQPENHDSYDYYEQDSTTSLLDLFLRTDATSPPSLEVEPGEEGDTGEGFVSNEFWQMYPSGENMDYEQFGYTAPENAEELWNNEQLVIFTFVNGNGDTEYRVYGTIDGENQGFFACDQYGNIFGIVVNIPITWEGEYDGETPGEYVLEAVADGYSYNGEMPTAIITVQAQPPEVEEDPENSLERDGQGVIAAFEPLDDTVLTQNVPYDTLLTNLNLPVQITAMLEDETSIPVDVTWTPERPYNPIASGAYVFTAVVSNSFLLDQELELAEDIELPQITVNVAEPAPIRVETREELINVFDYGAANSALGSNSWHGERVVEIAAENILLESNEDLRIGNAPGVTTRTITLRTDGTRRDIRTPVGDHSHFEIYDRTTLVIDDEKLHIVGNNLDPSVRGSLGGGILVWGGTLELKNGTVRNVLDNNTDRNAVCVRVGGKFIMTGGVIRDNRADGGGGVYLLDADVVFDMYGGVIENNYVTYSGAGVRVGLFSTFNMYGGYIRNNVADLINAYWTGGGGVYVTNDGLFNMHGGTIEGNRVNSNGDNPYGGGVFVDARDRVATFNMNGGTIQDNTAHRGGGVAVRSDGAIQSIFNLGTGRTEHGAAPPDQTGAVNNPTITSNTATGGGGNANINEIGRGGGGGVFVTGGGAVASFTMHSGSITNNNSRYRGGGIFISRRAVANIRGGEISGNRTDENNTTTTFPVNNVPLVGGGGIYLYTHTNAPTLNISNTLIHNNYSRNGGGIARGASTAAAVPNSILNISGSTVISGNKALRLGGGIFAGEPAANNLIINTTNVPLNRTNLTIESTVVFSGNRSEMTPFSYGLTVEEVRINSTTQFNNNIQWSGRNSAGGSTDNDESFHLFNNHDIGNLQGVPVILERDPLDPILAISKKVTTEGMSDHDFADRERYFNFKIRIWPPDGSNITLQQYKVYVMDEDGNVVTSAANFAGTILEDQNGYYFEISQSEQAEKTDVYLKHGQWLSFVNIEPGTNYEIFELPGPGYIPSYTLTNGSFETKETGNVGEPINVSAVINNVPSRIDFVNSFVLPPPVGINVDDLPFVIVLGFGFLALIGFVTVKTQRRGKNINR